MSGPSEWNTPLDVSSSEDVAHSFLSRGGVAARWVSSIGVPKLASKPPPAFLESAGGVLRTTASAVVGGSDELDDIELRGGCDGNRGNFPRIVFYISGRPFAPAAGVP